MFFNQKTKYKFKNYFDVIVGSQIEILGFLNLKFKLIFY